MTAAMRRRRFLQAGAAAVTYYGFDLAPLLLC